jgi:predicted methyltransferase
MMMNSLPSAVQWSHHFLSLRVKTGDWVVDATMGNGYDTRFLADRVGEQGRVFAFDVQAEALVQTQLRLAELASRCELYHASHARMAELLPPDAAGRLAAVIFNLGYLPGKDKSCITQVESTLAALSSALTMLTAGGLLVVVVYPGHAGGDTEAAAVATWLSALPWQQAEVQHLRHANKATRGPECWVLRKR